MDKELIADGIRRVIRLGASPYDPGPSVNPASWLAKVLRAAMIRTEEGILDPLIETLRAEPELRLFDGGVLLTGTGAGTVTLRALAEWLVAQSLDTNPEEVLDRLDRFIRRDIPPAQEILAISGASIAAEVRLVDGIRLVPFAQVPRSGVTDLLKGIPSFMSEALQGVRANPIPTAALIAPLEGFPALAEPTAGEHFAPPSTLKQPKMYRICQLLTLVGPSPSIAVGSWVHIDDSLPLCQSGASWGGPLHELVPSRSVDISAQAAIIPTLVDSYFALPSAVQEALDMPMKRLNLALRRQSLEDAAVELRIALESLLAQDLDENAPVGFTLRLRGSLLGASGLPERRHLFDLLTAVYSLCSQAAHGGRFKPTSAATAQRLIPEGIEICASLVLKVIERGSLPQWRSFILDRGG